MNETRGRASIPSPSGSASTRDAITPLAGSSALDGAPPCNPRQAALQLVTSARLVSRRSSCASGRFPSEERRTGSWTAQSSIGRRWTLGLVQEIACCPDLRRTIQLAARRRTLEKAHRRTTTAQPRRCAPQGPSPEDVSLISLSGMARLYTESPSMLTIRRRACASPPKSKRISPNDCFAA